MRLYKPTIYRAAAALLLRPNRLIDYACVALGEVFTTLPIPEDDLSRYLKRKPFVQELEEYFKPENCATGDPWFESREQRILALLFMAEITKGQYITIQ